MRVGVIVGSGTDTGSAGQDQRLALHGPVMALVEAALVLLLVCLSTEVIGAPPFSNRPTVTKYGAKRLIARTKASSPSQSLGRTVACVQVIP